MGNQNKTQRNIEIIRNDSDPDERDIIHLDEIVEQWVWYMWNKTKSKSLSQYKREDLLITINWKHVLFIQDNAHFSKSSSVHLPRSQILFRTNFDNKTANEQLYTFSTERFSHSTFKFLFTHSLHKSQESTLVFPLPERIVRLNSGIQHDQYVPFGQDTTKEYKIPWNVNSQIRVPACTRIDAEFNIDEEEFCSDFSLSTRFSGRITATIATLQLPNTYLKLIDSDIVQIVREVMKTNHQLDGLEILEGKSPSVWFKMRGKCLFRYGIGQHVVLDSSALSYSDLDCIPSAPLDDCHSTSVDIKNDGA